MDAVPIDAQLVQRLIAQQFPEWSDLSVVAVKPGGWDNRTFRLGAHLVVRLPSNAAYASQVAVEHQWLRLLAPRLPLAIPQPLAVGAPGEGYRWPWSVRGWIVGEPWQPTGGVAAADVAQDTAQFLLALQCIQAHGGPPAGVRNFHRGGALSTYDAQTQQAIALLGTRVDARAAQAVWATALASSWQRPPVWVHGDIAPGNLLMREGRLAAVIDFGQLCVGDPACDLAIAWTCFDEAGRRALRDRLPLDLATWARGRGWALWKALIVAAGLAPTNAIEFADPVRTLDRVLHDTANGSG